jgi:hypothetical protein
MLTAQGVPSDWLGEVYEGKNLREPINVVILDGGASSPEDAKSRLLLASTLAGYPIRFGHSTGYQGYIGGQYHAQLPHGRDDAFSNDIFEVSNNHGRVFGPHLMGQTYVFTAPSAGRRSIPSASRGISMPPSIGHGTTSRRALTAAVLTRCPGS